MAGHGSSSDAHNMVIPSPDPAPAVHAMRQALRSAVAGVAPDAPPAPGFDCSQVLVAMTDWDNSEEADGRINAIAAAFPRALLYYERPGPNPRVSPKPDAASQVAPTETNGGAWLRSG